MKKRRRSITSEGATRKLKTPFLLHWPSGPLMCCKHHCRGWLRVAKAMGAHVVVTKNPKPMSECINCVNEAKKREAEMDEAFYNHPM